jgi:HEPN domain-containing protein
MPPAPSPREEALFHCQQAAAKAIKAFLTLHQIHFQKTHDLCALATSASASTPRSKLSRLRRRR